MPVLPLQVRAEILGDYLGAISCKACHEEIYQGWKSTPHSHAFATLKEQGLEKQSIPDCVKCHVVAFEQDGGYVDLEMTPELTNVQCESCHGAGKAHIEAEGDPEQLVKAADEASCRVCHTTGQDKNFDFNKKKLFVHGMTDQQKDAVSASLTGNQQITEEKVKSGFLAVSQTRVKFGNLVEGNVAQKVVTLSNTGGKVFKIINVTTS